MDFYGFLKPGKIFSSSNVEFQKFVAWQILVTKEPFESYDDSASPQDVEPEELD